MKHFDVTFLNQINITKNDGSVNYVINFNNILMEFQY